uniref:Uncharacterized protein n=1 Tax=Amphimedon queenslandica TaxID=400682 RepID=A0A1X7T6W2_AMPQE
MRRLIVFSLTLAHGACQSETSHLKLPKVDAARSPRLDSVMKTVDAQSTNKELFRLQTFILDALAPLTAILEASILIGNANAKLTHLRREKLISAINDDLTPLIQDESQFTDTNSYLFGSDFAKQAKEYLDQAGALKSTTPDVKYDRRPLFVKASLRGDQPEKGTEGPTLENKCIDKECGTSEGEYNGNSVSCNGDSTPKYTGYIQIQQVGWHISNQTGKK